MSDQFCLAKGHLLIIFCIFIGFSVWYIHNDKKKYLDDPTYKYSDTIVKKLTKTIEKLQNKVNDDLLNKNKEKEEKIKYLEKQEQEDIQRRRLLEKRDNDVIYNISTPPERRQPEHAYPFPYVKNQINIPTRGLPDNYHMMGLILRNNTESAFNLFGRQTFPGSNQWEYFVQGLLHNNNVKIPIKIRGDREIEDGQTISVPGMDASKGHFKVKLYNYDAPRYNPFIKI